MAVYSIYIRGLFPHFNPLFYDKTLFWFLPSIHFYSFSPKIYYEFFWKDIKGTTSHIILVLISRLIFTIVLARS